MNTQARCHAVLLAVLLFGGFLSPVQAEGTSPPAYGLTDTTLGCDKTDTGLRVTVLDPVFRHAMRAEQGIDIALNDPCLPALAKFPPSFLNFLFYMPSSSGAPTVDVPGCIIWIVDGADVFSVLACDIDEEEGTRGDHAV